MIGSWYRQPQPNTIECKDLRNDLCHYISPQNVDLINTYADLCEIAEPSGTMKDTHVFACAPTRTNRKKVIPEQQEAKQSDKVPFSQTEWPFPNYASRILLDDGKSAADSLSQVQTDIYSQNLVSYVALRDVQLLGGHAIRPEVCLQCKSQDVRGFCAYHQVYTCDKCNHAVCADELKAYWILSDSIDNIEASIYRTQTNTIAVMQFLSPYAQKEGTSQQLLAWIEECRSGSSTGSSSRSTRSSSTRSRNSSS